MVQTYTTAEGHRIAFEPSPKWVRVMFGGEFIADSKRACLLLPGGGPPFYYFPRADIRMDFLQPGSYPGGRAPLPGEISHWTLKVGNRVAEDAAWSHPKPLSETLDISDYIAFQWNKMDAWFEEGEEVFVHPHDPYHRIDVLQSTRHVRVEILGEKVAESHSPVLLFETGLPVRYYLPKLDVRMELLQHSYTTTGCAYKGRARYYSVKIDNKMLTDAAWYYTYTTTETSKIAGKIAFFNELVDLYVDGALQLKPKTGWSR